MTITLPTPADVRERLEGMGLALSTESYDEHGTCAETWTDTETGQTFTIYRNGRIGSDASRIRTILALLGIGGIGQQEGVTVPVDVANKVYPWILKEADACEKYARMCFAGDDQVWVDRAKVYRALAAALSATQPQAPVVQMVPTSLVAEAVRHVYLIDCESETGGVGDERFAAMVMEYLSERQPQPPTEER